MPITQDRFLDILETAQKLLDSFTNLEAEMEHGYAIDIASANSVLEHTSDSYASACIETLLGRLNRLGELVRTTNRLVTKEELGNLFHEQRHFNKHARINTRKAHVMQAKRSEAGIPQNLTIANERAERQERRTLVNARVAYANDIAQGPSMSLSAEDADALRYQQEYAHYREERERKKNSPEAIALRAEEKKQMQEMQEEKAKKALVPLTPEEQAAQYEAYKQSMREVWQVLTPEALAAQEPEAREELLRMKAILDTEDANAEANDALQTIADDLPVATPPAPAPVLRPMPDAKDDTIASTALRPEEMGAPAFANGIDPL